MNLLPSVAEKMLIVSKMLKKVKKLTVFLFH